MAPTSKPKKTVPASSDQPEVLASRIRPATPALIEALEPRVVFSVNVGGGVISPTTLNVVQVNEIVGGLEDIGTLANQLEQAGALGAEIEALGMSFGELFNFGTSNGKGGFLGDAFVDQLSDLMSDPALQPAGPSVAQINTWLGTSPLAGMTGEYNGVTWSLVQGGEYTGSAHPLEWEVVITGTKTTENDLAGGSVLDAANISLDGAKVSTDASAAFKFSFGLADTDGIAGLSVGDSFFATFGDLTFTLNGSAPTTGMGGAAKYTVGGNVHPYAISTGSTVSLGAQFGGVTIAGTSATTPSSRLDLAMMTIGFGDSDYAIATTTDDGLQATLQLQRTPGSTAVQLKLEDAAILDGADATFGHDVSLVDFVAGGNVTGIFQKIQDAAQMLDINPLRNVNLPGIATALNSINELPDFQKLLSLRNAANNYMTSVASPSITGLATQLNSAITAQLAGAGITLDTLSLTTEFDPARNSMTMNFAVDTGDITKSFEFDRFGAAAAQAGLSFERDQTFTFDATLRAEGEFNFGLDLNHGAGSQNALFFQGAGLGASASFDVTGIDLEATLGPVAAGIVDGEMHATAALDLSITDAFGGDNRFTLAELNDANRITFGLTPTGTFEATLPLDIQIAGATFVNPTIKLQSASIFTQLPTVDTTTANFDKIFNMGKVGPEAILDLIIAVGDWAGNFRDSSVFNVNIPFLDADLGNAFDFSLLFTKNLRDKLQNDLSYVALDGNFAAFTLAADAPLVIGNGDFAERIVLPAAAYATKAAFITALNTALGNDSKFEAEAHGDNGVRIAAKDANEVSNFSVMGAKHQLKTIGFVSAGTAVTSDVTLPLAGPTNGKIAGNAQFQLSIDGATPVTVTVAKTSTDDNSTLANLATDLDTALSTHGIDAAVAGDKIKLTRTDGKSFMIVGVSGTSFQQLGLENASAAGLADLGSTLQSGLNYNTLTDMVPFLLAELGVDDGDSDPTNDPIQARYDLATESFIFKFQHEFLAPSITLPVGFEFDLAGWARLRTVDASGNPASATLSFTPTLGGSFEFGISLADDSSFEELAITAPTGFAPKGYAEKADGSPDSNNAIAWDGKLSGDAIFKISFDDGVEHTLTVLKSVTDANTTMAHLLADVTAAISANAGLSGKLGARIVAKDGATSDRIEFYTIEQTGSFQLRDLRIRATGPDKMGLTADQLELSAAPVLAVANNSGATMDYSPSGDVQFTIGLDGGTPVQITVSTADMSTNASMKDLLADINAAIGASTLAGQVKAVRYGLGNQFQLVAADGTRQMTFSADRAATHDTLRFSNGTDAFDANDIFKVTARSRGGTFFIQEASLEASATLALSDLNLAADIGFIGITTNGLAGSVTVNAGITVEDSDGHTRFEVGELFSRVGNGSIGDIVQLDFDGEAHAEMSGLQISAGDFDITADAEIALDATNIFAAGGPDFTVTFDGFDFNKLNNLSNASWREIYEGIKLGVSVLSQTEQFGFLKNTTIPLINVSVSDIFTYTDQLVAIVDQLEADPGGALDSVERQIEELLGIPDENFDLSLEGDSTIKIHLDISTSFSASYGLDFNLASLNDYTGTNIPADLLNLGGFLDASAEGSLQVGAYAGVSLDLGIDFSNGAAAPNLIVYATSGVDLGLRVSGQNLNITASFGPAGFAITDGSAIMDGDGLFDDDNLDGIEDNTQNDGNPLVPGVGQTWVDDDLQDDDFAIVHLGPLEDITDLQGVLDDLAGTGLLSDYFGPTFSGIIVATLPGAITSDIGSLDLPGPIVLKVEDLAKLFRGDADAVELTLPDMSDLLPEIPGLLQLLRDPAILLDGVDSGLGLISKLLSGKAATNLPLIGDQLRQGSGFIEEFRAGFLAELTNKLRGAGDTLLETMQLGMFDLFASDSDGATGLALGILMDYNGDGAVTAADVVLTFRKLDGTIWQEGVDAPQDQDAVMFNLHLGQDLLEFGTDLDIEWGLPGLELDINGSPKITAGWDLYFGFGVSVTDFFFLDAAPPEEFTEDNGQLTAGAAVDHELSLSFEVVLTSNAANPFSATGKLFFLQLDATDKLVDPDGSGPEDAAFSHLSGAIFVDLTDPGVGANADDRLTVRELFSRGAIKPISAGLEAEAVVNLALAASVGGSTAIPRILADFYLDWSFQLGSPVETPDVGFKNARLDLGSFVSDFLKPIVDKIDEIISPFDPVLDALQMRIPVLSDIMGRDYTVLDLAVQFGKVDRRFVDAVLQVRQLVADISALPDGVSIEIPIGSMTGLGAALKTKGGAKTVNTASAGTGNIDFGAVQPGSDAERYRNTFNKSTSITGGGFGFPILKPANAFKLLLGQDATLVTYDIPRLEAAMSMSRTFPIWGPLVGKFNGSISAYADFAVGFDTKGFNTFRTSGDVVDILDGFYVSDRANADGTGADVYEAGFKGRIGIGGAINAAIIEAGIEGFFELRADLDLKDPNDDGKIRGSEIIALITHPNGYGPLNLGSIRLRGDVGARAYVDFWAPFDWYNAWEWEFARVTLFDKTFTAPDVTPKVAGSVVGGTLTLNAGPTANQRQFISTSDVGEEFVVSGTGKNITVTFTNTGHTQSFSNVDRLVMNGGKGNDRLIIGAGVTTAITFNGGEGDDYFEGGAGADIVSGGIGNDTIIGGLGANVLDGGDGADTITGGSGDETLIGGKGDDLMTGGGGNDTYRFADDWGNDFFDGDQTGTGKFDFTPVTQDLTLNISARGAQGSSGSNFIAFESDVPYVTSVKGGSGNDVTTVAATGSSIVTVDGGVGSDQYIVSFGRLDTAINIADSGSGLGESDSVTIRPLSRDYTISVGDLYVSGVKGVAPVQRANFANDHIENLTVDAKTNGGSVVQIAEAISFTGDVRLLARQALIGNSVDAANLRVESTQDVNIAANVNAHGNGDVTVLVNTGNITISQDVMSSSGTGFTGDGAGLVHLFTSSGAISTGTVNGSPGSVLAANGSLLLRGTGSIGTAQTPIFSTVATLAVSTTGNSLINLHESDGVVVGTIASIEGITATGGTVTIFNDDNVLQVASRIEAGGGDTTLTSDEIEIDANISSPGGDIFLRPEGDLTVMAIGDNVTGQFALDQSEITHLQNGFTSIQIGLPLGRNLINLGDVTFQDVTMLQNPVLGGHINQTGVVNVTDGASFTILGSGHTTELDNQNVAGNIDIIDSAVVKQGETVTLTSTGGAININFDLDGTAGGADEILILNAAGDVVIKGAIGSVAKLGTLRIIGATNIRFEGSVNVETLIMDAGTTFTVDGTVTADDIQLNGVAAVTFHSGVALTTAFTTTGNALNTLVFEGQVSAPAITISAKQLVDFYQLVDVTSTLSVTTTQAAGDIVFRQQVNAHSGDIAVQSLDDITFIGPVAGDALSVAAVDSLAFQANVELLGALTQTAGTGVSTFAQLTAASANISSAGVLLGGITTLNGAAGLVVNVGNGTFSASNSVSAPNGPLNLTARSIAFQSTVSAASATFNAIESITVANAASFTLTGALSATTTSGAIGEIKFSGPVDIGTNATLNTPRGLTFQDTLAVDGALTVQAASSAAYQGAVNVGGAFTQQNGVTGATSFTATVQAGSLNLQAGSFAFSGDVNSNGAASLNANTGGITATSNVSAAGVLTANAATNLALQGATTAHQMMLTAAGTITVGAGGLNTAASPTTGNIVITTTGPVAGNSVTLNGAVQAKGGVMITGTQGVLASNTINAASLNASGSALTFNSLITTTGAAIFNTAGALNVAAGLNADGPLTVGTAASVNFGDSVTAASASITATNTINVSFGGLTSTIGNISLTTTAAGAGNAISALGLIDAAATLTINTPRGASLNLVEAANFIADAASIGLNAAVATAGATTLTAAASGNITVGSTITTGGALTINRAKAVTFGALVSADSVAIGQGVGDRIETVAVGVGGMTATNDLRIRTTVAGAGSGITAQGALTAGNAATLALDSARGVDVTGSIGTGDLTVNGASITLRSPVTAADDVTLASLGAVAVNANLTATGDIAVNQAGALTFGAQLNGATLSIANTASATFAGKATITGEATISVTDDLGTSAEFSAGSALNIASVRDLNFGGFVNAGSVNIGSTTARTVTVGSAGMIAAGDVTIATNVAGTGNGIITNGPVTAGAANAITLTSVRGVEVNGTLNAGDVNLSGSPLIVRGVINAGDDVTFSSPGTISITADLTTADDVIVTQAGALTLGAKLTANDLLVSNTGNATFVGAVTLSGTANLALTGDLTTSAGFSATNSIVVSTVRDVSFGGLVSSATVNIGGTSARTISVSAAGVATSGALTMRSTDAAGALNLNGPLTATSGAVTLSALGAITSTATINGDSIVATSSAMSLGGALVADGTGTTGSITLDSTAAGTGTIMVGGVVTSTGSLLIGGTTAPQSASLNGALNIGHDLIVRASETITTGAQVAVTRDTSVLTTSTTAGEVRLNGSLTTGRDLLLNTPRNATFLAPVTVGRDATVTNAAALQFDGALNVTGALTQAAGTTSSRFASISAASIAIDSPTVAVTNAVTATTGDATFTAGLAGKVTVGGNTNVAGALSVTRADEVILTGNVTAASVNVGSTSVRTMTFGTNLNATTSGMTLIGANGPISVLGTLNATGALNIPTGTVITLNGAVSAASAAIAGGTLVTGNDVTTTTGGLAVTTSGDVTVGGKTTVAQTLSILGSDDVNLSGAVTARDFTLTASSLLAGGAFTTNVGDANFTTTGNIRIVGLTSVAEDLSISTALNATFQGQVSVAGALTQQDGGGATRFEGVTSAASLNVRTAQQIFAGSTFRALSGDMRLEADEIDFFGGTNAVQGTANLVLRPYLAGTSIDIGSPTPTGILDLSDVDLNALQDGFTQITIGRAEDGTGAMLIGSSSFKDNVAFHAGSTTVESNVLVGQVLVSLESIEMTARTGSITTNDDVLATDVVMTARDHITINNKVEVADFVTFSAGTDGSGNITHNGTLSTSAANGMVDFTAGANAGSITISGTISTFDFDVTAESGAITQTAGNTKASDILALAQSGITLLTTADHISARVTGNGDLTITDTNPSSAHFLDLGSKTDLNDGLFTADGDITVLADQNVNAYRVNANGAVTIETGGEVYLDNVNGAPVSVTGTILIDEDRTTNGEEIRFDGNIRLLRDITLTSNGGNIIITGRVNGTNGQHYGLTFNAGGGDVTIGNGVGSVTPLEFLQVNDAGTFTMGNGVRVEDDLELNADAIAITAPAGSIRTTNGGELRLLPNAGNAAIDIGGPAGGNAAFSLNDAELAALGDGFSRIQLGQRGGTHDFKIESARFLDDLEINGDNVTLLTSSIAQAVNGLSVVNGADDNDITINARTSFNQGSRAALTAGRNGNIAITADTLALDAKSRGLIRGFGELLLQPFSAAQAMTLGGAGAGFEITAAEFGAFGDTFTRVTIGRADGAHVVNIQTSLSFRDNTIIRTPLAGGSVTIGNGAAPITVQTVGRADSLRIESAGTISIDGSVKTVGRGDLELLADFDHDGAGDLLIGQNLTTKANKTLTIGSELGAIRLQGENVAIGLETAAVKDAGIVNVKSLSGDISIRSNADGDTDGGVTFRHTKSAISTNGIAKLLSANGGGVADLGAGSIFGKRGVDISGFAEVLANATKVKADAAISVEAVKATLKAKSAFTSLAEIMITGNQATGVIALEKGASVSAKNLVRLDAFDVQRDPGAAVKAKTVIIDEL